MPLLNVNRRLTLSCLFLYFFFYLRICAVNFFYLLFPWLCCVSIEGDRIVAQHANRATPYTYLVRYLHGEDFPLTRALSEDLVKLQV
jgi:hypothetical protein